MAVKAVAVPEWTLGDRLTKARKLAGMTQDEMAEELDLSHSTIAKWEVDAGQPRNFMKRIQQWADLTGVPAAWLLGVEESNLRGSSTRSNHTGPGRNSLSMRPQQPKIAA